MLQQGLTWDEIIRTIRREYESVYSEDIIPEIDKSIEHIPSYLKAGVILPGRLPLINSYFKSKGISGAIFFFTVTIDRLKESAGKYLCDFRVTTVARFKYGEYTNCITFTGDPDALYWQHFFERYQERDGTTQKIHPEKLYLDVLSHEDMWQTSIVSYKSDKYDYAYVRPWGDGIALGSKFKEGELRGTYISREIMREDQDVLCRALIYMGDLQRIYGYKLEDNMERTMLKFDCRQDYAEQITKYFIYYWQVRRIGAFLENRLTQFDKDNEREANRFFQKNELPIDYRRDCMIPLRKPRFFSETSTAR